MANILNTITRDIVDRLNFITKVPNINIKELIGNILHISEMNIYHHEHITNIIYNYFISLIVVEEKN